MTSPDTNVQRVGGRYVLIEPLATGAGSEVWRAHDDVANRSAAVKLFRADTARTEDWRVAFRRATDRLVALSHPGIAKTYDHGEDTDGTWLAMAYACGETLSRRLAADQPPSAAQALDTIGQIALALTAAHDAGISHGHLDGNAALLRDGDVVSLVGFAVDGTGSPVDDLRALSALAEASLESAIAADPVIPSEIREFPAWIAGDPKTRTAGDVGRTALALAATVGDPLPEVGARSVADPAGPSSVDSWVETSTGQAGRKQVRNRLIALATIVVVFGGALLWIVDRNGGPVETTVPNVVQLDLTTAQGELTTDALHVNENLTDPNAIVTGQFPAPGTRVKVGTTVTLTVSQGGAG